METDKIKLWNCIPGECNTGPTIVPFIPETRRSNAAIVIFPGGAYCGLANHEGEGYAKFFYAKGIPSFVVNYRVAPHHFPAQLSDARRAVQWVRHYAGKYRIDPHHIAVMGSSAGGHLAALCATYKNIIPIEVLDEIDFEDYWPNLQILCYPVICAPSQGIIAHTGSYLNLIGYKDEETEKELDPCQNVSQDTPQAFIWHTSDDKGVNVINSYRYATQLRISDIPVSMHIFPHGRHGLGLAENYPHVTLWKDLLLDWLREIEWLDINDPERKLK